MAAMASNAQTINVLSREARVYKDQYSRHGWPILTECNLITLNHLECIAKYITKISTGLNHGFAYWKQYCIISSGCNTKNTK